MCHRPYDSPTPGELATSVAIPFMIPTPSNPPPYMPLHLLRPLVHLILNRIGREYTPLFFGCMHDSSVICSRAFFLFLRLVILFSLVPLACLLVHLFPSTSRTHTWI